MGIQNLYSLLSKFTESDFKYEEYHKMTVGIDFSWIMHQWTCLIADNKIKSRFLFVNFFIWNFDLSGFRSANQWGSGYRDLLLW